VISHFYDSSSFVKFFVREGGTAEMLRLYSIAERRSLDAIQLASALCAVSAPVDAFVVSDLRLLAAAKAEGLNILDPATMTAIR
jgi:predicted nucleic acid-binding protein